ncbi:polysaccharide deacetylase family protein [Azospirillum brasilense]|uniref:polysaccharide deacetylase family protein n=1 Tax=Azospirillum brasilense TaxID=192 RepID=UPI000E6910FF|nr:polysaccharide deacetylase family protein [Azospirillum brasilense]NUB28091.1 polysaccharide deacetylase family protein [Azospirillum brasilense]NUB34588.1 polysaccharide deacetylase family protein [Azospirillum brasilense]RIW00043.1 polysaccharide deacetylase family protein [Azospirillum brasilense]
MSVADVISGGGLGRRLRWTDALRNPLGTACHHAYGSPVLAVVYHAVCDTVPDHLKHIYRPRTPKEFTEDLDFLLKHFEPTDLPTVTGSAMGGPEIRRPSLLVTFDDGMREVAEVAMPILRRKGIRPALYLNLNFLDNRTLFYRHKASLLAERLSRLAEADPRRAVCAATLARAGAGAADPAAGVMTVSWQQRAVLDEIATVLEFDTAAFLADEKPYLTRDEIADLMAEGVSIGAHGFDHPNHRLLTPEQRKQEVTGSVAGIRELFGPGCGSFAFPYSDEGLPDALFGELYGNGVDVTFGTSWPRRGGPQRRIQRICFENGPAPAKRQLVKRLLRGGAGNMKRALAG